MITDSLTIVWKELKEMLLQQSGFRGGRIGMLVFIAVFGIYLPLQSGRAWVDQPLGLLSWAWLPFLLVSTVVADSFAGERERHTLETLLASRLSDRAILFGKILAAVLYGWGITMIMVILSLVTVNVVHGNGELLLYPTDIATGIIGISLLVAMLASGLGVLVSLRASTVRQAQQTFSIAFFLLFVPLFLLPMLPAEWQVRISQAVLNANISAIVLTVMLVLLVVDILLLFITMARFQRSKLILD